MNTVRDPRTYIRVHDGMPDHPKIDGLSDGAFRLLITTWCWCGRHLTDGHVPRATWEKRGTRKFRQELLDAGLAVVTPTGVEMHDYLEHNRSAEEATELVQKRRKAGAAGGRAKAANLANGVASASGLLQQMPSKPPSKSVAEIEIDKDKNKVLAATPPPRTRDEIFDAVVAACGIDPNQLTGAGRAPLNRAVKDLRSIGASSAQITLRARRYREKYRDTELTPMALAKHWASLNGATPQQQQLRNHGGGW